ncbi:hypothetical protein GGR55DRAFT_659969 [Xylaria sp. FL0064]|nr:hypothetical protein GGR55DRAFT_659969 [Xylaria sp. FL0064]
MATTHLFALFSILHENVMSMFLPDVMIAGLEGYSRRVFSWRCENCSYSDPLLLVIWCRVCVGCALSTPLGLRMRRELRVRVKQERERQCCVSV